MSRRGWWPAAVGVICVVAAVHAAVVAGHYVVGSFDDDGHYLALAKAFAHGKGYVDTSIPGAPTESLYPPGYPLLLTPLLLLAPHAVWPLRLLSALAFVGCLPLLDALMRRRDTSAPLRAAVLLLYALNPVAATFASEVMPESVFLFVLLLVLLALPRWERQSRLLTWSGAAVAIGAPYLLLLKTAGLPMLAGVGLWLAARRHWRQVAALAVTSVLLIGPVVVARASAGPVVGTRYTNEYHLSGALLPAIWHGAVNYVNLAIPATLVPTSGAHLLDRSLALNVVLKGLRYTAAALVAIGFFAWLRRRVDVSLVVVPLYLAETLPFPFINERRVILLLPWVVAWYVLGWATVIGVLRRWRPLAERRWSTPTAAAVPGVLVLALLSWQFPRDYLLRLGESTPAARGSGYVAALREMTPAGWRIATGYQWTVADLTGRTATNVAHFTFHCPADGVPGNIDALRSLLARFHVATVLDAALKWPGAMDNPCVRLTMTQAPWAVAVYDGTDESTVFALVGPGTARPDLAVAKTVADPATDTTTLDVPVRVREVSAEIDDGGDATARLELRDREGRWHTLPTTATAVAPRLLHAELTHAMTATAVRVVHAGGGHVHDLVVLAEAT